MKPKPKIEVSDESPLRWPDGWPHTFIEKRVARAAWKKPMADYRKSLTLELERLGVTAASISFNVGHAASIDPGVAVWFSVKAKNDFGWQAGLHLDNPAPSSDEIAKAFRELAKKHHPEAVANGSGGDIEYFYKLDTWRKQANAWIRGESLFVRHENCIPCDVFHEVKWNIAGIRLALSYFRGLERLGQPAIVERIMDHTFRASLPVKASSEEKHVTTLA
jgi:hypothetical protein